MLFRGEIFTADSRLQDLKGLSFFTCEGKGAPCCRIRRQTTHEVIQLYRWAIPVQLGILLRQLRCMRGIRLIKALGLGLRLFVYEEEVDTALERLCSEEHQLIVDLPHTILWPDR